eukprot:GHRR01008257.1.p1 GENE.GHRR01008257.1~~GHRR01008257.1.p1  ORF type:complete len:114 (-),score=20.76 GHRR01008257.1:885-1226(-)
MRSWTDLVINAATAADLFCVCRAAQAKCHDSCGFSSPHKGVSRDGTATCLALNLTPYWCPSGCKPDCPAIAITHARMYACIHHVTVFSAGFVTGCLCVVYRPEELLNGLLFRN